MGLLTADPYENAWIILGLGIAALVVASIIGGGVFIAAKDKIPTLSEILCTGTLLVSALIPLGLFSSGIFVDFINQSYQYSTGSVVGFLGVLFTSIFGSSKFADFSKSIVGFLPPVKDASGSWSWLGIGVLALIISLLGGAVGASFGAGGTQLGEGITIGVVAPLVLILLAGTGLMGEFSMAPGPVQGPDTIDTAMNKLFEGGGAFKIDPFPSGYCDVPGFSWASNFMAPASIVLTQTIMWFHMIQGWATGNASHTALLGSSSLLMFALQWWSLAKNGCLTPYRTGVYSPLISLIISIAVAGASYGVIKNIPASSSGPSKVSPTPGPTGMVCPKGYDLAPNGDCERKLGPGGIDINTRDIVVGGQQKTSAPVDDDQDAFVCEAYKDGELITSTIVD